MSAGDGVGATVGVGAALAAGADVGDGVAFTAGVGDSVAETAGNCAAVSEVAVAGVAVGVSVEVGADTAAATGAGDSAAAGAVTGIAVGVRVEVGDGAAVATGAGVGAAAMSGTVGDADALAKTGVSSGSGGGSQAASDSAKTVPIRASAAARSSQFAVLGMMKPSDDARFNVFHLPLILRRAAEKNVEILKHYISNTIRRRRGAVGLFARRQSGAREVIAVDGLPDRGAAACQPIAGHVHFQQIG